MKKSFIVSFLASLIPLLAAALWFFFSVLTEEPTMTRIASFERAFFLYFSGAASLLVLISGIFALGGYFLARHSNKNIWTIASGFFSGMAMGFVVFYILGSLLPN